VEALDDVAGPQDLPGDPACPGITPTENWAAYARDDGLGLVLAMPPQPNLARAWALCLLYDGPPVAYISPLAFFDFAPGDTREMHYYLIPGDVAEGRARVYDLLPHTAWHFNLDYWWAWEGWRSTVEPGIENGIAYFQLTPALSLFSRTGLSINGRISPTVTIVGRSLDQEAGLCLEYRSIHAPAWITEGDLCRTFAPGEFAEYVFPAGEFLSWRDSLIYQLQLRPEEPASFEIDSIIVDTSGQVFDFFTAAEAAGLQPVNQLEDLVVEAGSLRMRSVGDDPYLHIPLQQPLEAGDSPTIEIRMKISAGTFAQVFFQPAGGVFSEENSLVFEITDDGAYHTYTLDLSSVPGWDGQILQLRLDPTDTAADIEIDYILIQ
jgi:hypothetical protein